MTPQEQLAAYASSQLIYACLPTEDDPDGEQHEQHELDAFAPKAFAALRAVLDLCDKHEHGATRWDNPLPIPSWIAEVRTAISSSLEA